MVRGCLCLLTWFIPFRSSSKYTDFYIVREPTANPKCKLLHKTKLLWRPEIAHIQELNNLPAYRQKSKDFVRKKILEKVPEETLHHQISDEFLNVIIRQFSRKLLPIKKDEHTKKS